MKDSDLPESYQVYDHDSNRAQRIHFGLIVSEISLILVVAITASTLSLPGFQAYSRGFLILILTAFFTSIVLRLLIMTGEWERKWFAYRSVAESSKKLAWQYMMKVGDYAAGDNQAAKTLHGTIAALQKEIIYPPEPGEEGTRNWEEVTQEMDRIRNTPFQDRLTTYLTQRVADQIRWYRSHAGRYSSRRRELSAIVVAAQLVGVALSATFIIAGLPVVAIVGFVVTLIAVLLAWTEAKHYGQLIEPYQLTARELASIYRDSASVRSEGELSTFVIECEATISREHTSWRAKSGLARLHRLLETGEITTGDSPTDSTGVVKR